MGNSTKKLSVSKLEAACKKLSKYTTVEIADGCVLTVKRTIGMQEMLELTGRVLEGCIIDGSYTPALKSFLIKKHVLEAYTNISLPQSIEKQYELIYGIPSLSLVFEKVDKAQLEEITEAVDASLEFLIKMGGGAQSEIAEVASVYKEVRGKYTKVISILEKIFDSVDVNRLVEIMSAMTAPDKEETYTPELTLL